MKTQYNYQNQFLSQLYVSLVIFIYTLILLIVCSAKTNNTVALDQGIANFALTQPYISSFISRLSSGRKPFITIPLLYLIFVTGLNIFYAWYIQAFKYLKQIYHQPNKHQFVIELMKTLYFIGYPGLMFLLYYGVIVAIVDMLKVIFDRPRPYHTIGFISVPADEHCGMQFTPAYRRFSGYSECGVQTSFPSGHVGTINALVTGCVCSCFSLLFWFSKQQPNTPKDKKILNISKSIVMILGIVLTVLYFILIPGTMYSRIVFQMHWFSDTLCSAIIGQMLIILGIMLLPSIRIFDQQSNQQDIEETEPINQSQSNNSFTGTVTNTVTTDYNSMSNTNTDQEKIQKITDTI